MRLRSPLKISGSCSRRRFSEAPLCKNWWLLWDFRRVILPVPVILNLLTAVLFVFSFGIFLTWNLGLWIEDHDHEPSFHCGRTFNDRDRRHRFRNLI